MKYRSRTDIVATILDAANGGSTKTKIMYKAYLSYTKLKEYLTILVENGLLEYEEGDLTYKTIEKGLRFMRTYNEIGGMVSPEA
jgi:predicted transcriptional regulator